MIGVSVDYYCMECPHAVELVVRLPPYQSEKTLLFHPFCPAAKRRVSGPRKSDQIICTSWERRERRKKKFGDLSVAVEN
jgi:hypothetical protein